MIQYQPCRHIKGSNFIETYYFVIILSYYNRVKVYLVASQFLRPKTKRKGFIFHPYQGNTAMVERKKDFVMVMVVVGCACVWREIFFGPVLTPTSKTREPKLVHFYIGIYSTPKGRISMRTDSSTWKVYLLALFCACILPFFAEFPDLPRERRRKLSRVF